MGEKKGGVHGEKWGDRTRYGYTETFKGGGSITTYRGIDDDDPPSSEKSKEDTATDKGKNKK